jgi:L-threonylcarbamoyladenylate synthase
MNAPSQHETALAAERLRRGGLVAFPTETVYGLAADAMNEAAVARIFALKGRPTNNPLIVHVADESMAKRVVAEWPVDAAALARACWPGPLTIVVAKGAGVPACVTAGGDTVAVRCPDHPVALGLLRAFGGPIVGPSANPSGRVSPTHAEHVRSAFAAEIARDELVVLDGGPCRAGIESTVVDVTSSPAVVLRRGIVTPEQIQAVLHNHVEVRDRAEGGAGSLPSPGMLERHYSPRAPARLFEASEWPEVLDAINGIAVVLTHQRARVIDPPHVLVRMPMDAEGYAAGLYAALHEADAMSPACILIEAPRGERALWEAVRDRLRRACG